MTCIRCFAPLPDGALVCPQCQRLVHADLLGVMAGRARTEAESGDVSAALATHRDMLDLLPAETVQAEQIRARILELSAQVDGSAPAVPPEGVGPAGSGASAAAPEGSAGSAGSAAGRTGLGALVATAAALLWKGKFLVVFALTKAKFLLLGLTKLPTLLSMFVAIAAYAAFFGWPFALGFVLMIYVHETGHVVALRRFGIAATAPMFIPFLGAFVRLKQYPATPREDAVVGLAGPIWGLGAAVVVAAAWYVTGIPLLAALAHVGAWINLFNLLPVSSLDGGRGFRALDRPERWIGVASLLAGWGLSEDPMVLIVALVAGGATLAGMQPLPAHGDRRTLITYVALVLTLSGLLAWVPDPLAR